MTDFKIGEKAVYPAHGVAEVIGIEKKEINTTVCSFYVLKVLATGMQILVPKDKADQVGLRPVATSSEIEEVFDILGHDQYTFTHVVNVASYAVLLPMGRSTRAVW